MHWIMNPYRPRICVVHIFDFATPDNDFSRYAMIADILAFILLERFEADCVTIALKTLDSYVCFNPPFKFKFRLIEKTCSTLFYQKVGQCASFIEQGIYSRGSY
jgi:hypothetical protein